MFILTNKDYKYLNKDNIGIEILKLFSKDKEDYYKIDKLFYNTSNNKVEKITYLLNGINCSKPFIKDINVETINLRHNLNEISINSFSDYIIDHKKTKLINNIDNRFNILNNLSNNYKELNDISIITVLDIYDVLCNTIEDIYDLHYILSIITFTSYALTRIPFYSIFSINSKENILKLIRFNSFTTNTELIMDNKITFNHIIKLISQLDKIKNKLNIPIDIFVNINYTEIVFDIYYKDLYFHFNINPSDFIRLFYIYTENLHHTFLKETGDIYIIKQIKNGFISNDIIFNSLDNPLIVAESTDYINNHFSTFQDISRNEIIYEI